MFDLSERVHAETTMNKSWLLVVEIVYFLIRIDHESILWLSYNDNMSFWILCTFWRVYVTWWSFDMLSCSVRACFVWLGFDFLDLIHYTLTFVHMWMHNIVITLSWQTILFKNQNELQFAPCVYSKLNARSLISLDWFFFCKTVI